MANHAGPNPPSAEAAEGYAQVSGDAILRAYGGGQLVAATLSALARTIPAGAEDGPSASSSSTTLKVTRGRIAAAGTPGWSSKVTDFTHKKVVSVTCRAFFAFQFGLSGRGGVLPTRRFQTRIAGKRGTDGVLLT